MPIIINKKGYVLQVILNSPEKRNAFDSKLIAELIDIFSTDLLNKGYRLIHLFGKGPDFCAGADLKWMQSCSNMSNEDNYHDADKLFDMYKSMQDCNVPIITQVHGNIFGGGVGLCSASDIVIADHESKFSLSETKRGLIPAVMLPIIIDKLGKSRVRELLITGRQFVSDEAKNYGLVHFVITDRNSEIQFIENIFNHIISCAPNAVMESRRLINLSPHLNRHELVESLANIRVSEEAKEGLKSFFEKRLPKWVTH